jgi:hypothetical protein
MHISIKFDNQDEWHITAPMRLSVLGMLLTVITVLEIIIRLVQLFQTITVLCP